MWEGARGVWEGCEKDVVGVQKGSRRGVGSAGGVWEVCRRSSGGLREVCVRSVGGLRDVCRRSAGGVREGCGRFGVSLTKIFH